MEPDLSLIMVPDMGFKRNLNPNHKVAGYSYYICAIITPVGILGQLLFLIAGFITACDW